MATKEINEMSNFIVHILEQKNKKLWEIRRDSQGKIIGLNISLVLSDSVHLLDSSNVNIKEELQRDKEK
jgi:hypothetical protein